MKQRTKKLWAACFAALWLVLPAAMQAQVHIGGTESAVTGALLDLTTPEGSNLGLLPLNVNIDNLNEIPDVFTNKASIVDSDLQGLIVYNTNGELADGAGLYVWDGAQWHVINAAVPVTGVTVSPTSKAFTTLTTQQLTATVAPTTATNKAVTWESSNTAVATVSASGLVTAIGNGSATITVTTTDGGHEDHSSITVVNVEVSGQYIYSTNPDARYYYVGMMKSSECMPYENRPVNGVTTYYNYDVFWPGKSGQIWTSGSVSAYSQCGTGVLSLISWSSEFDIGENILRPCLLKQ
ncbi:MAG: Ig-like domain-containing protein [Candidatus Symbiothrix sp.]|nr:Ig-like domain-containing protein [Candidatus Symbiothrix sp.]